MPRPANIFYCAVGAVKAMRPLAGRPMVAHVAGVLQRGSRELIVAGDAAAAAGLGVGNVDDAEYL